jgi:hypothetical protein
MLDAVPGGSSSNLPLRSTQVIASLVTIFATAWVCTLGVLPAIIALSVAKHVLVAILVMGLGVDQATHDDDLHGQ